MNDSEIDLLLDWFLAGKSPADFATKSNRSVESIKASIRAILTNEKNTANLYRPVWGNRKSRAALPMNERDKKAMADLKAAGVSPVVIARILSRTVEQVGGQKIDSKRLLVPSPITGDFVLAFRYSFHVYKLCLISDKSYDEMVAEEKEFGTVSMWLGKDPRECPPRIKTLALYLVELYENCNNCKPQEVP